MVTMVPRRPREDFRAIRKPTSPREAAHHSIGAYKVGCAHRTFLIRRATRLRRCGARRTTDVVLVVAADDGVPQTVEATNQRGVGTNPGGGQQNRQARDASRSARAGLAQRAAPEDWGGDTIVVMSAGTRGSRAATEMILLQAELSRAGQAGSPGASCRSASIAAAGRSLPCSCRRARSRSGIPSCAARSTAAFAP